VESESIVQAEQWRKDGCRRMRTKRRRTKRARKG